jgi:hypothetical protein
MRTGSEAMDMGDHGEIEKRRIDQVVEKLQQPDVMPSDIEAGYREIADDSDRERAALEWSEGLVGDSLPIPHASR